MEAPMSFIESQTLGQDAFSALDAAGTFIFALSGANAGARRGMDLFGALLLAFVTATAGGIMTDLLIGATPPHALASYRPFFIAMAGGLTGFVFLPHIDRFKISVLLLDAVVEPVRRHRRQPCPGAWHRAAVRRL